MARKFTSDVAEIDVGTWNVGAIQTFTMGLWVYIDAFNHASDARFLSKAGGVSEAEHSWMIGQVSSSGLKWRVRFRAGATPATDTFIPDTPLQVANTWYLAIVDYDGTNVQLHVNDVQAFSTAHSVGGNMDTTNRIIYIGNNKNADKGPNGRLAEVFVLSELLNSEEKTRLFHGAKITDVHPSGLEAYWPLDHRHGITDVSINQRHGISNATVEARHPPVTIPRRKKVPERFDVPATPGGATTVRSFVPMVIG